VASTVLITGAARGIGRATARAFLDAGWRVLSLDKAFTESAGPALGDRVDYDLLDLAGIPGLVASLGEVHTLVVGELVPKRIAFNNPERVASAVAPFMRRLSVAGAPVIALRVNYVGELGWELHVPVEFAAAVCDALTEAGRPHGLADAGYRAIESLRLEKGYRAWGVELGPDHSPSMAGLDFAVRLRGDRPFLGRTALEAARDRPLPRLLAGFAVDAPGVVLLGRETIFRDGRRIGWLASGGWGHTVGRGLGYGYVRDPEAGVTAESVLAGKYELEVGSERVRAEVFLTPLYDPDGLRIRA
jgi:4-methylaminobutanoate oxidase (formaldehyde-forming)